MKKLCIAVLVLLLAAAPLSALAEQGGAFSVSDEKYSMLFSLEGEPLTPRDAYYGLYCVSPEDCPANRRVFSAMSLKAEPGKGGEEDMVPCALLDAAGNLLTDDAYDYFTHFWREGVVLFYQDGFCGAMDEKGRVLLEANYGFLVPNGEGGFLGAPQSTFRYGEDGYAYWAELCFIDADGKETALGITTSPYEYSQFSEGLLALPIQAGEAQLYGYVNPRGEIAIEPAYAWAEAFSNGLAVARTVDGKCGLLSPDGTWAIEPKYQQFSFLNGAGGTVKTDSFLAWPNESAIELIDFESLKTIKTFRSPGAAYFSGYMLNRAVYSFSDGERTALCDPRGNVLFSFDMADGISIEGYYGRAEGLPARLVKTEGDWPSNESFLILPDGTEVAGPYQALNCVSWEGDQGRYLVSKYELAEETTEDGESYLISVWDSYRYGLIDQDGKELLPVRFRSLWECAPGLYWAREADFSGLIDEAGNWLFTISDYEELVD